MDENKSYEDYDFLEMEINSEFCIQHIKRNWIVSFLPLKEIIESVNFKISFKIYNF